MIRKSISHDRSGESFEANARWFRLQSIDERLDVIQSFAELSGSNHFRRSRLTIQEVAARYVLTPEERIRITELPR